MFFISPKKLFSFWRYLSFCSDFFFHVGKWLDVKVKVNFKIYHIANWEIIETHTLSSVSRSKGNQTIKFGQLVEYNIRNIFFENSCPKCDVETTPRPFSEKWKLTISMDQDISGLKFHTVCLILCQSIGLSKYIETKVETNFFYLTMKPF